MVDNRRFYNRYRTLTRDLIIGLSVLICLFSVIAGVISIEFKAHMALQNLDLLASQVADDFSNAIRQPLIDDENEVITKIANAYLSSKNIAGLVIRRGEVDLFSSPPASAIDNNFIIKNKREVADNTHWVDIRFYFSKQSIMAAQKAMIYNISVILTVVLLCVILGTSLLMKRFFKNPIKGLLDGIPKAADVDCNTPLPLAPQNDINAIINNFNVLLGRVTCKEKELLDLKQHLKSQTEKHQQTVEALQEGEAKYRGIFENATEGIFRYQPDGLFLDANPAMAALLGFTSPHALISEGADIATLCYASQEEYEETHITILEKGSITELEKEFLRLDGTFFLGSASIRAVRDKAGELLCFEGMLVDITDRKTREKAAKKHVANEFSSKAESACLANMSHEIRTPINAIMGLTDLALKTELSPKQTDYLSKIKSSSSDLLSIINAVLDYSKLLAGNLKLETVEFNLERVLNTVTETFVDQVEEKKIELHYELNSNVPVNLIGDPLRLGWTLNTLTKNALKFTEKSDIVIQIECREKHDRNIQLQFAIGNSGNGLSKNQLDHWFHASYQSDTATETQIDYKILELVICKALAQKMGGEIKLQNETENGSKIFLTTELGIAQTERPTKNAIRSPRMTYGLKVLVVDDNQTAREILQKSLESFHFDVFLASSGKEALTILEQEAHSKPFDLVLMDWKMPGMDGIETSKRIKSNEKLARIPAILMVTAYGKEEIVHSAKDAGIDAFLLKPVQQSMLMDSITQVFNMGIIKHTDISERQTAVDKNPAGIEGKKVLLVEDNAINQQVAVEHLEYFGLKIKTAANGREALDILQKSKSNSRFDVVLMDIQMPIMDGYEATRNIRADKQFDSVPIIAMTADNTIDVHKKCLAVGMNDFVNKPIDVDQIINKLLKWTKPAESQKPQKYSPIKDKTPPEELPFSMPGINIQNGINRLRGNQKLYVKLLRNLYEDYHDISSELRNAKNKSDFEYISISAHTMKGVAGNIGAEALAEASRNLELCVKNNNFDEVEQAIDRFDQSLKEVFNSVETIISDNTLNEMNPENQSVAENPHHGSSVEVDKKALTRQMLELNRYLEEDQAKASNCLNDILKSVPNTIYQNHLLILKKDVDNYDFLDAQEKLVDICDLLKIDLTMN